MMNNVKKSENSNQAEENTTSVALDMREHLTAIHVAAQLMCRQSEGRQTYPVAKSIVMLTEQALATLRGFGQRHKDKT